MAYSPLSSMIRHPVQGQQTTGGGEGAATAIGVDLGQKLSLAELTRGGYPVQHGPEFRLQRDRGRMTRQGDRAFAQAAQRADFNTISAEAGAPWVRIAWRVSVTKTRAPAASRISARSA